MFVLYITSSPRLLTVCTVKPRAFGQMNLYRSFGNLMEAWVAEESQCSDLETLGNNDEDSPIPSSATGTNLGSESLDSGVETPSSDASFPATSCFVSAGNTEIDAPERDSDELTSTSPCPFLPSPAPSSSSSPRLCSSRAQEGSAALNQKVELALKRITSKHLKSNPDPLTGQEVLWQQPGPSLLPKRPTSELVRGQRSQNFGARRRVHPSVSVRQMSENWRRQLFMSCDQQRSEDLCEEKRRELSPGLIYLEQVCQMLEEIARQQMQNQALQIERVVLQQHQDTQDLQTCQIDSGVAQEKLSSCQGLENTGNAQHSSTEPQRPKDPYRRFRPRSASDTTIASLHPRKLNADCRGQHLSTNDLHLETAEEDHKKLDSIMEERNKPKKKWTFRIGSLRREESTKSLQMQPPEKNPTRRRLSQLFRRNRTLPE